MEKAFPNNIQQNCTTRENLWFFSIFTCLLLIRLQVSIHWTKHKSISWTATWIHLRIRNINKWAERFFNLWYFHPRDFIQLNTKGIYRLFRSIQCRFPFSFLFRFVFNRNNIHYENVAATKDMINQKKRKNVLRRKIFIENCAELEIAKCSE